MSSPSITPLAPTRWAAIFEKQAESTVGDYDMRASAAYIRSPIGSPQLRGLQRSGLDLPLLGATKAPAAAPAALEESGATAAFKAILYGFINTIVVTPVMIGFCAIIFRHEAFHRDPAVYAQLVKLCLFSSAVHQAVFTATSSLPFAIGQVQDAGLIFLSKMACDLANEMEHEPPEALLSTVLVTLSASTALLGLALIITGKLQLAALVQYLPLPVVGGYLAFIGLYCFEAGLSLMTGLEVRSGVVVGAISIRAHDGSRGRCPPWMGRCLHASAHYGAISSPQVDALLGWDAAEQWSQLLQPNALSYFLPGVLLGVVILVLVMRVRHFLMLPTLLLAVPVGFYLIMSVVLGFSLEELRGLGLVAQEEPSADPWHVFSNFKFGQVHRDYPDDQLPFLAGAW